MAYAKKCDRCGRFYDEKYVKGFGKKIKLDDLPVQGIKIISNPNKYGNYYDLCPECIIDLLKFMNINEKGEGEE